jgi:hypothetical protein
MDIPYLIQLLTNRQAALAAAVDQAFGTGDLERISSLRAEADQVADTLVKLKLAQALGEAATAANVPVSEIVSTGIETVALEKERAAKQAEAAAAAEALTVADQPLAEPLPVDVQPVEPVAVEPPVSPKYVEEPLEDSTLTVTPAETWEGPLSPSDQASTVELPALPEQPSATQTGAGA